MERKFSFLIIFLILTITGVAFLGFGLNVLEHNVVSGKWPTTNGITRIDYLIILFGLILILFGVIFLFLTIKQDKGTKNLDIILNKTVYSPGEKIQGTIFLKLKKPVQAHSLKIFFIGERIVYEYPSSKGVMRAQRFPFMREELSIDGDTEYCERSYTFEITIPQDILKKVKYWSEGTADVGEKTAPLREQSTKLTQKTKQFIDRLQTIGMARYASGAFFYVEAILDVPHGINIQNDVEIEIQ